MPPLLVWSIAYLLRTLPRYTSVFFLPWNPTFRSEPLLYQAMIAFCILLSVSIPSVLPSLLCILFPSPVILSTPISIFISSKLLHIYPYITLYIHISQINAITTRSLPNIWNGVSEWVLIWMVDGSLSVWVSLTRCTVAYLIICKLLFIFLFTFILRLVNI